MEKAQDEAPKDKIVLCAIIEHNMEMLKALLQHCSASSTPAQSGRSSPVAPVPASEARPLDAASLASDLEILTSDLEILSI